MENNAKNTHMQGWRQLFEAVNEAIVVLDIDPRVAVDPATKINATVEKLRKIKSKMESSESRVGQRSITAELSRIITGCISLSSALADNSIKPMRARSILVNLINQCQDVSRMIVTKTNSGEIKKVIKKLEGTDAANIDHLEEIKDAIDEKDSKVPERIDDIRDHNALVDAYNRFTEEKADFLERLKAKKLATSKKGYAFSHASITFYSDPFIPEHRLNKAGIKFTSIKPALILHDQPIIAIYAENDEDVESLIEPLLARYSTLKKRPFVSVLGHSFNGGTASTLKSPFIRMKGLKKIRFLWVMDRDVYRKIGPIVVKDCGFPW